MRKTFLTIATCAGVLASPAVEAQQGPTAQQDRPGMMMQQHGAGAGRPDDRADDGRPGARGPGMMGPGMMGPGMMGRGMMGHDRMGPRMLTIMMALVDANGDRALSLEEVQAVHARIFKYADADSDGKLTEAELRRFLHGDEDDADD